LYRNTGQEKAELPFIRYFPETLGFSEISYRDGKDKWPTLRYILEIEERRYRVKEFFLDWFYPGFPKSLMSSFMGTFSKIDSIKSANRVFFTGGNYKGRDAASSFIQGTQVEVEALADSLKTDFRSIYSDLVPVGEDEVRLRGSPFSKRSYFASGHRGEWFEDQRISRLQWADLIGSSLSVTGRQFNLSSAGALFLKNQIEHSIIVFESGSFESAGWVDIIRKGSRVPYGSYDFRDEEGIFDFRDLSGVSVLMRRPYGPGIVRWSDSVMLYTLSLSPLAEFPARDEMKNIPEETGSKIEELLDQLSETNH